MKHNNGINFFMIIVGFVEMIFKELSKVYALNIGGGRAFMGLIWLSLFKKHQTINLSSHDVTD